MTKSSCWSITINNPTEDDLVAWSALATNYTWIKKVEGQLEKGEEGTPHIQGMVTTGYGRFFNKLKEALPRAHIEASENKFALANYVHKPETRIGEIATVKVAGQSDLQNEMCKLMMYGLNTRVCNQANWDKNYDSLPRNILVNADDIRQSWELILDEAVKSLIIQGYYGVEFVVSNNQVRNAFKRYLPEILYRTAVQMVEQ